MKFNEAKKIIEDMKKSEKAILEMVDAMGAYAINHYKQSFRDEGFTDEGLEKWTPRKRTERSRSGNRAILTKTGRLKRSLVAKKLGRYAVRINSNVPYAVVHNEGGTINKKAREHILNFNKKGNFQRQRTESQRRNTAYSQKVEIGAHKIKIPKRQFVGYSGRLARKIEQKLDSKIRAIFK